MVRFCRAAAALVIMYRFTAVPHVLLYSSTINNVVFTAVGRQMSGSESSLPCFNIVLFFRFFFRSFFRRVSALMSG